MVGLSDIPCAGKIVDRISDAAVDPLFRGFNYMFFYKDHVNVLNSEIEKVKTEEAKVSRKVDAARADGKKIYGNVLKWQKDVEEIQESAKVFLDEYNSRSSWRCIRCLPVPKPVSRLRLGRKAVHEAKRVTGLFDSAKDLLADDVGFLPPVENVPTTLTVFQEFKSRKHAYEALWEALVDDAGPPVLGIYGMPGVGKTRMMEQIWQQAKEKKIFDKVARADVGQELDVIKVQNQIASHLDCHFESKDDKMHRANQLKCSLMNGGKVLLILDDVWMEIPFDIIGIPLGDGSTSKGFKILITSREDIICLRNSCKHPIKITILTADEAWDLFRNTVGASQIDSLQDESLAKKVCNKCAGLPLLIHAVGKALQYRFEKNSWKDALGQLEKGNVEKIPGIEPQVYACVRLSIDRLPDDAKFCLFLCSLYPEDAEIYVRKLIQVATDTQLVPEGENRVHNMVDVLRSSSLLLDLHSEYRIKLHDLIRDVARSIAARDPKYAFSLVRCGLQFPHDADYRTQGLLHLYLEKNDVHFRDGLVYPDLHNLWLQGKKCIPKFSDGFLCMFANLSFLLIEGIVFSQELKFSLHPLVNLMALLLEGCDLTYINQKNVSFFPEKLKTLCIWNCDLPVPLDLPNLKHLRKLEIHEPAKVQMVPNTISSIPGLEELHIPDGFKILDDGAEQSLDGVSEPIWEEISKLTTLKSLQMSFSVGDFERLKHTNIFSNLLDYDISVGFYFDALPTLSIKRIRLRGNQLELGSLKGLIERAEDLTLYSTDINVGGIYDSNREAFADLRSLRMERCNNVEYLSRMTHGEIQHQTSFSKLTFLKIYDASAMKYVFSKSVAKCLVRLQHLSIQRCPVMEAIVMNEGTIDGDDDIINFSKLKSLSLANIPRLKSFYMEKKDMHSGPTTIFNDLVAFPALEELQVSISDSGDAASDIDIWGENEYDNVVSSSSPSFCKLERIQIYGCTKLKTAIPLSMSNKLQNLKYIGLENCKNLRKVFQNSSITRNLIQLKEIKISGCHRLRNVFQHSSMARDLINLQLLDVRMCRMMRVIIGEGEELEEESEEVEEAAAEQSGLEEVEAAAAESEEEEEISDDKDVTVLFPELTTLSLKGLDSLTSFWCNQSGETNPSKIQFPNLVDFTYDLRGDDSNCQLRSLAMTFHNKIRLSGKWLSKLYNLEFLTMIEYHWWPQLKFECFKRLKSLKVHSSGCSTLFSFSSFESLHRLQVLEIQGCALLEEIVEDVRSGEPSGTDKRTVTFFQLESVSLKNLPNLKSCFHGANYEWHMPALGKVTVSSCGISTLFTCSVLQTVQQLKHLNVRDCILLEDIVEDAKGVDDVRSGETSGTDKRTVTFFQLESVTLHNLPNLKSCFHGANYEWHMPALEVVTVSKCGISTLFTCSVFQTVQQLTYLAVEHCILLEDIVDAKGDETSDTRDKIITLPRFWTLVLTDLPNLKSFSFSRNSSYAFNMPKLNVFRLHKCPRLENFTFLKTSTPLVSVDIDGHRMRSSDLNDCIRENCKREDKICNSAGESSCSQQQLEIEPERVAGEQIQETEDND